MRAIPIDVTKTVLRDPSIRRVLFAFLMFSIAEQAAWIAMLLVAYQRGGVGHVGLAASGLLVGSIVLAPFLAVTPDRYPDRPVMAWGLSAVGATLALCAVSVGFNWPSALFYGSAAAATALESFARPTMASRLPLVAETADQLTAARVAMGFAETTGALAGPILVGLMLSVRPVADALGAAALIAIIGAAVAATVRLPRRPATDDDFITPSAGLALRHGIAQLRGSNAALRVALIIAILALLLGAIDVSLAAIAVQLLGRHEASVGLLAGALGAGGVGGAGLAMLLVGRRRLGLAVVTTVLAAAVGIVGLGLSRSTPVTLALLALIGGAMACSQVACQTLIQGLTPTDTIGRIFGLVESLEMLGMAAGGLAVSALVGLTDFDTTLVLLGLLAMAFALGLGPTLAAIDANRKPLDPSLLRLLRSVPIFAPLPAYTLEQLVAHTGHVSLDPGERLMTIGEPGETIYIVGAGTVQVILADGTRFERGVGAYMGEIAILRNCPRSATVEAGPAGMSAYSIDREVFLGAVTGVPRALARAEAEMARRLD
ncbi:MAG: cyclic nucleotide-binding domain-containing protein [Acidimicrobiales bacterium]